MTYKTKFYFHELFLAPPFSVRNEKNWNVLPKRLFQQERQSWEQRAQLGTLVGLLLATTGLAASAKLELSFSASSSQCGLCRWPDCNPCRLGAHAHVPRVRSWGNQGQKPDSTTSGAWGSSKKTLHRWWLACSDGACLFLGSHEGSLAAAQNSADPPSESSSKTRRLAGILLKNDNQMLVVHGLVEPLVEELVWIHSDLGHLACQASRWTTKRSVACRCNDRRKLVKLIMSLNWLLSVIECVPTRRISYVRIWYAFGLLSVLAARWIFSPTGVQFLVKCRNPVCDIRLADDSKCCRIFPDG